MIRTAKIPFLPLPFVALVLLIVIPSCVPVPDVGGEGKECFKNGTCSGGLECIDNKCLQAGLEEQPCLEDWECTEGLTCIPDEEMITGNICISGGGLDQPCVGDWNCEDGLICISDKKSPTENRCVKREDVPLCPGYTDDDYCCQADDICGYGSDEQCDCGGTCPWEVSDCAGDVDPVELCKTFCQKYYECSDPSAEPPEGELNLCKEECNSDPYFLAVHESLLCAQNDDCGVIIDCVAHNPMHPKDFSAQCMNCVDYVGCNTIFNECMGDQDCGDLFRCFMGCNGDCFELCSMVFPGGMQSMVGLIGCIHMDCDSDCTGELDLLNSWILWDYSCESGADCFDAGECSAGTCMWTP